MKKSLRAFWLLILLPFGLAQAAEFKLTGRTSWQLGQLMVNGIPFVIDERTRFRRTGWMRTISAGPGSIWKGWCRRRRRARRLVREVEPLEEEDEMELEGPVEGAASGVMSPRMGVWLRSRGAGWSWSAGLTACA